MGHRAQNDVVARSASLSLSVYLPESTYAYCVLVSAGVLDMEVSDVLAAASGVEGVLTFEPLAGLSFFKTSSTLRPPALMSSPTPCIVLHPAMKVAAAAIATNLRFITISCSGLPKWSATCSFFERMAYPSQSACPCFASAADMAPTGRKSWRAGHCRQEKTELIS